MTGTSYSSSWESSMAFFLLLLVWISSAAQATHDSSSFFVKVAHHHSQIKRSFKFPVREFGDRTEDIRLVGNAAVMGDGSIKIPALDSPTNQAGRALFASPVRMWDPNTSLPASFETSFSFVIHRETPSSRNFSHQSGGGLAFIIAPDEMTVGREAGYLGMLSDACVHRRRNKQSLEVQQQHPVIAVEFDTFKDSAFEDPNDNHVGFNLGSVISDETADLSSVGVFLRNGSVVTAKVSYDSSTQLLEVRVSSSSSGKDGQGQQDSHLPLISSPVDLSSFLKEYMFVGFSASTGAEALSHTVLSWNFSCTSHAVQRFPPPISASFTDRTSVDANNKAELYRAECEEDLVEDKFDRDKNTKRTHPPAAFFVFVSVSATLLIIILNVLIFWRRNKIHSQKKSGAGGDPWTMPVVLLPRPRPLHRPREFDLHELVVATDDFAEKQKLGEGPLGIVYRGNLQDGSPVAIKRFDTSPADLGKFSGLMCISSGRARKQQLVEEVLPALSRLRHPHLVPLRGWCISGSEFLVVYDYMPNASLDKWLHPVEALITLPWVHRWKLVKDVATALQYLHSCNFLQRRMKSSNVLLDIAFEARIGDYGFSDTTSSAEDNNSRNDYHLPPEMMQHSQSFSKWSQKTDVYGFGVICLELVSGSPPWRDQQTGLNLVDRAWLLHGCSRLDEIIDSRLERSFDLGQAMALSQIGLLCSHKDPDSRPSMETVVSLLEGRSRVPHIPARESSV